MNVNIMTVGMKLELEILNSLDQRIGQPYVSQLLDITDKENIIIAAPIHEARLMLIPNGTRVRLVFQHSRYGLLNFTGTVNGKEKKGNIFCFDIGVAGPIEKIQRRMYFRLPCTLSASYCVPASGNMGAGAALGPGVQSPGSAETPEQASALGIEPEEEWKKAVTRNVSGSGASIVTDEKIEKGSIIKVRINLDTGPAITGTCKVMRSEKLENSRYEKYELGLHFQEIENRCQEALVKFIFDQQKKLLRNNLGDKI